MIQCPYCASEMPDEASSCPRCLSLLIEDLEEEKPKVFPRLYHPLTVFLVLALLAAGLLSYSIVKSGGAKKLMAAVNGQGKVTGPGAGGTATTPGEGQPGPGPAAVPGAPSRDQIYNELVQYENAVQELIQQADALAKDMDAIRAANDKSQLAALGEKLNQFMALTQKIRALSPIPPLLQHSHTLLANAFAIRHRGYRELMAYLQSGDMSRLQKGQNDLATAETYRGQALQEMEKIVESNTPPPPAPPPPPPEPNPTAAATAEAPPPPKPAVPAEFPGATPSVPQAGGTQGQEAPVPPAVPAGGESLAPAPMELEPPFPGLTPEPLIPDNP